MNGTEARRRLSACRCVAEDRDDPFFAEALDRAAHEPGLAAWWAGQRALDEVLSRKLRELAIPAALQRRLPEE